MLKRIFFLIIALIFFIQAFALAAFAEIEPLKVMSLHYDNSSALVYITTKDKFSEISTKPQLKFVRLTNPNRIYFDINNAVLIGEKQQLIIEKSDIKEIRLAQFETNPQNIVRVVLTFEEDFDTSKIKLLEIDGNIIVKIGNLPIKNDYFNAVYDDRPTSNVYSSIAVNSQFVLKVLFLTYQNPLQK